MIPPSISLLLNTQSPISENPIYRRQLRAHIIHSFLFHQSIIFPATQLVRSPNFRRLLFEEISFPAYFSPEFATISSHSINKAIADPDSLSSINKEQVKRMNAIASDDPIGTESNIFDLIDKRTSRVQWRYHDAANIFTASLMDFFESGFGSQRLGRTAGQRFCEAIEFIDRKKRNPKFSSIEDDTMSFIGIDTFFGMYRYQDHAEVETIFDLPMIADLNISKDDRAFICDYALGIYHSNVPMLLSAHPICDSFQSHQISLVSREYEYNKQKIGQTLRFPARYTPSEYVDGLNVLKPHNIWRLRETDSFRLIQKIKAEFDGAEQSLKTLQRAIVEYSGLIDEEIIRASGHLGKEDYISHRDASIWGQFKNGLKATVSGEIVSVLVGIFFPFGGTFAAKAATILTRKRGEKARSTVEEKEIQEAIRSFNTNLETLGKIQRVAPDLLLSRNKKVANRSDVSAPEKERGF